MWNFMWNVVFQEMGLHLVLFTNLFTFEYKTWRGSSSMCVG